MIITGDLEGSIFCCVGCVVNYVGLTAVVSLSQGKYSRIEAAFKPYFIMGIKHPFCALYALALVGLELVKHTKIEAYNGGRVGGGGVALQFQLLGKSLDS